MALFAGPAQRTGTEIREFGRADFDASLIDWGAVFNKAQQGLPQALELIDRFSPGGEFEQAAFSREEDRFKDITARSSALDVASGISGQFGRTAIAANRELGTVRKEIRSESAKRQIAAFQPFTSQISTLGSLIASRPSEGRDIQRISSPLFGDTRLLGSKNTRLKVV